MLTRVETWKKKVEEMNFLYKTVENLRRAKLQKRYKINKQCNTHELPFHDSIPDGTRAKVRQPFHG